MLTPITIKNRLANKAITSKELTEKDTSNQKLIKQKINIFSPKETEVLRAEAMNMSDFAIPTFWMRYFLPRKRETPLFVFSEKYCQIVIPKNR